MTSYLRCKSELTPGSLTRWPYLGAIQDAIMEKSLGIWQAACPEGAVWSQVTMHDRHLDQAGAGSRPVFDNLAQGPWRLAESPIRLSFVPDDLEQFAGANLRKHFGVEKLTKVL
jgi:hypothetical protein